ncbi:MAG: aminodeoxychorismate synthase component I [Sorangiineae bacterium]|nr:aminodeoxychorismate synthase component I [Polyangiaceae bacterium]MEB2325203.1 aminodeoxychorismate synthase component I [Sorangiineae bacterium]
MDGPLILLEAGPNGGPALFAEPREVLAVREPEALAPALARLDAARAEGRYVAGFIAYEAAYALAPRLAPLSRGEGPLLVMGVFDEPRDASRLLARADTEASRARMTAPEPRVCRAEHARALAGVKAHILAGDCYQVNLTFPLSAQRVTGTDLGLYGALRRAATPGHGAYVALGRGPVVISCSPELFFRVGSRGNITARPMKGTRPRDPDPEIDARLAFELATSVKDRAENLMIVDLLRSDLGRLARAGSVRVPQLYAVERYPTVHQMTSTITAELSAPAALTRLLPALFPCGSITGAPKLRAMEIIAALEPEPRGVYCGAIGWMAPDGGADFSVAIRTLAVTGDELTLNVGGGVVADSTADGEWEEALWKARFAGSAVTPSCG